MADEDAAAVILAYDAFGQGEAQAPSAFLGGEAGVEHRFLVFARDTFAGVGDGDAGVAPFARGDDGD